MGTTSKLMKLEGNLLSRQGPYGSTFPPLVIGFSGGFHYLAADLKMDSPHLVG